MENSTPNDRLYKEPNGITLCALWQLKFPGSPWKRRRGNSCLDSRNCPVFSASTTADSTTRLLPILFYSHTILPLDKLPYVRWREN